MYFVSYYYKENSQEYRGNARVDCNHKQLPEPGLPILQLLVAVVLPIDWLMIASLIVHSPPFGQVPCVRTARV